MLQVTLAAAHSLPLQGGVVPVGGGVGPGFAPSGVVMGHGVGGSPGASSLSASPGAYFYGHSPAASAASPTLTQADV
eukprot:12934452-Prorocentrum_lima.AAC.1